MAVILQDIMDALLGWDDELDDMLYAENLDLVKTQTIMQYGKEAGHIFFFTIYSDGSELLTVNTSTGYVIFENNDMELQAGIAVREQLDVLEEHYKRRL